MSACPDAAVVRARTTNGEIAVEGITGRVFATTTNGGVNGRELSGGVDARATNGRVAIDLQAVGDDPIDVRTTNGNVQVTLPNNAKANVSASCVNGAIDVSAVMLEPMGEQSKRRVRGRMNGGGTPIEVADRQRPRDDLDPLATGRSPRHHLFFPCMRRLSAGNHVISWGPQSRRVHARSQ